MVSVADRHETLIKRGKTVDDVQTLVKLLGDPMRYEENDDRQANIYIEDEGWFAVTGDRADIAGYASCFGRYLNSLMKFEKIVQDHPVRNVRTNDDGAAFVTFKGKGEYVILANKPVIWKAALAAL